MNQADRQALIEHLAPPAPRCFETWLGWVEWLISSEHAYSLNQGGSLTNPLVIEAGQPVRFNANIGYCDDCTMSYRSSMLKAGRCNPSSLRLEKATA